MGHVELKKDGDVGKRVRRIAVGQRKRGRPRRRRKECIKEDMMAVGVTDEDEQDMTRWRRLVRTGVP